MADDVKANYKYWQENGKGWFAEYEHRKTFMPYFHFQEIFLSEYVGMHAPARVLEFGSGVGRHLKNLKDLPGIDIYGFDQSPTMIADMAVWASSSWTNNHVRLGKPLDELPFEEDYFDLVYTSEVLVHVRPEDISKVISNIIRVARKRILHIEPQPDVALVGNAHNGCWGHDLKKIYKDLGIETRELPKLFNSQSIIEANLDSSLSDPPLSQKTADLFRILEESISPRLNRDIFEENLVRSEDSSGGSSVDDFINLNDLKICKPYSDVSRQRLALTIDKLLEAIKNDRQEYQILLRQRDHLKDHITYLQSAFTPLKDAEDKQRVIKLTLDEQKNAKARGKQMWVRSIRATKEGPMLPWTAVSYGPTSQLVDAAGCMYDQALLTEDDGTLEFLGSLNSCISFMGHGWSGQVKISLDGKDAFLDLYREDPTIIDIEVSEIISSGQL